MVRYRQKPPVITPQAIDAGDMVIGRGAVAGVSLRYVPATGSRWLRVAATVGGVATAIVAAAWSLNATPLFVPAYLCLSLAACVAVAWGLSAAPAVDAHWRVDLLTISGPVAVYHSPDQVSASRVATDLAATIPR